MTGIVAYLCLSCGFFIPQILDCASVRREFSRWVRLGFGTFFRLSGDFLGGIDMVLSASVGSEPLTGRMSVVLKKGSGEPFLIWFGFARDTTYFTFTFLQVRSPFSSALHFLTPGKIIKICLFVAI